EPSLYETVAENSSPNEIHMTETQRHRGHRENLQTNQLTQAIIEAAIEVHKRLGPGLLESAYRACLAYELRNRWMRYRNNCEPL
ncbi:MAG: GxxExxY protein, partial [Waddliaceae bacterium]